MALRDVRRAFTRQYEHYPRIAGAGCSALLRSPKAFALPLRVQIENITVCNLDCIMCPLKTVTREKGRLTLDRFKVAFDAVRPPYLHLSGFGESFLNKDFLKMVSYASAAGSFVKLDSNGTLLKSTDIDDFLDCGPGLVSFSIDGATPETMNKIRGTDLDVITSGVADLVSARDRRGSPLQIHVAVVVQPDNVHELADFVGLGEHLGVDSVNFTPVIDYYAESDSSIPMSDFRQALAEAVEEYSGGGDQTSAKADLSSLLDFLADDEVAPERRKCMQPWYSSFISWEGNVFPCCYYYDGQVQFGNVFETPFKEIWHGEPYRQFRRQLKNDRASLPICRECSLNEHLLAYLK